MMCNVGTYDERNYRHDDRLIVIEGQKEKGEKQCAKHFTFTSCVKKIVLHINNKFKHACKPLNSL